MNTKLYKQVYELAGELLTAAQSDDDTQFDRLYEQLKTLCSDNEADDHKNHPVQWETLADFTQDNVEALALYDKALHYAQAIDAKDYMASICYAMAILFVEDATLDKEGGKALAAAKQARQYAEGIEDTELQQEIAELLTTLEH